MLFIMKQKFVNNNPFKGLKGFLGVNTKVLQIAGLWNSFGPEHETRRIYTIFSWVLSAAVLIHIITQSVDAALNWGNLEVISANASTILTYGAAWIKQVCCLLLNKRICKMVYRLRDEKLAPSSQWSEEQKIIGYNYDRHARIMSWTYYVIGIFCVLSFGLTAIVSNNIQIAVNFTEIAPKKLPYRAKFPFDIKKEGYFELAFGFQALVMLFGPTINIGMDTFFVSLIIHSCGQYEILKMSLRDVKKRAIEMLQIETTDINHINKNFENPLIGKEDELFLPKDLKVHVENIFKNCIRHHQEINKFVTELEDVFNLMMLAQFLSSSCTLALIIFQITVINDKGLGRATFVQFLAISILQLLLYCWYGNELTAQSESVVTAAYESPWYEASEDFRRSLRIMVIRSMKTFRLTGGKLYIMSLETFVVMLKASFSYYTVLRQLNGS